MKRVTLYTQLDLSDEELLKWMGTFETKVKEGREVMDKLLLTGKAEMISTRAYPGDKTKRTTHLTLTKLH